MAMIKDNKFLDDMAKMAGSAAGSALEMGRELERMVAAQLEKGLARMKLVTRDEFDAVQAMAVKALEENEKLRARLDALEQGKAG